MNRPPLPQLSRFGISALLAALSAGSFSTLDAHPYSAKREFFQLKRSGEWINYAASDLYVEVVPTKFIGLETAFDDRRSCFFGFSQAGLEGPGRFQVQTRFVCFHKHQYQLTMKKKWCELGREGCEIDPGGISVGIGNLDFAEPLPPDIELPLPKPGNFYYPYPKILNLDVYQPLNFD